MKRLVRSVVRGFGFELKKGIDPAQLWKPDLSAERSADIQSVLDELAGKDPGAQNRWFGLKKARNYLSDRRIGFMEMVLDRCVEHGVAFDGEDVLDVGSGTGYMLRLINERFSPRAMNGYEIGDAIIELARVVCPDAAFHLQDFFGLEDTAGSADVVLNMEVLEHLVRPDRAVAGMLAACRPGGAVVLTVPNGRHDTMGAGEQVGDGVAYVGHINFWSPQSWAVFLEQQCPDAKVHTELLPTGYNLAIIRKPA